MYSLLPVPRIVRGQESIEAGPVEPQEDGACDHSESLRCEDSVGLLTEQREHVRGGRGVLLVRRVVEVSEHHGQRHHDPEVGSERVDENGSS